MTEGQPIARLLREKTKREAGLAVNKAVGVALQSDLYVALGSPAAVAVAALVLEAASDGSKP